MRRYLVLSLLFLSVLACGQNVTITGKVIDQYGNPYSGGTGVVTLTPGNVNWTYGNSPVPSPIPIGSLDSFGGFSIQLMNTSLIQPQSQSPTWQFSFSSATCAASPIPASFTATPLSLTSSQDITTLIASQVAPTHCPGSGSGNGIIITTVAGLATVPNKRKGTLAVVTDGNSPSDCSAGLGTTNVLCQYDGTTWSEQWLPLAGGTMTGPIEFGATGLSNPALLFPHTSIFEASGVPYPPGELIIGSTEGFDFYVSSSSSFSLTSSLASFGGPMNFGGLVVYANNAAALAGGLGNGDLYHTGQNPDYIAVVDTTAGTATGTIASGTFTLGTSSIPSDECVSVTGTVVNGSVSTIDPICTSGHLCDTLTVNFAADPTGITGYPPSTTGTLTLVPVPEAAAAPQLKACNNTGSPIAPGLAVTYNWKYVR